MQVEVAFAGPIKRPWPEQARWIDASQEATVATVARELGFSFSDLRFLSITVNGERATPATSLTEGDRLDIRLLIGGG